MSDVSSVDGSEETCSGEVRISSAGGDCCAKTGADSGNDGVGEVAHEGFRALYRHGRYSNSISSMF